MYRLVIYGLTALAATAIILSFFQLIPFGPLPYIYSLLTLSITTFIGETIFAKFFKAPNNKESAIITTLILFLIMFPVLSLTDFYTLIAASLLATASKYIFSFHQKHIFNPAASAAVILGILGSGNISWWIATPYLFIPTLIVGLLVVKKIRRFPLFLTFLAASLFTAITFNLITNTIALEKIPSLIKEMILSWPLIFFGAIMLTEPSTTPPQKNTQIIYAALVGIISNLKFNLGPIFSTPELALLLGNIFSYTYSFKHKLDLTFTKVEKLAENIYEFTFAANHRAKFQAGQYMEWTLQHDKPDNRGIRRYFTISSAPEDKEIKLGIKVNTPSSSFKQALQNLKPGSKVYGAQVSGDFVLPQSKNDADDIFSAPLVFIAGGIGITPFISMLRHLIHKHQKNKTLPTPKITLIYCVKSANEIAYKDLLDTATQVLGLKFIPLVNARITQDMITNGIYYLSGPSAMVDSYKALLKNAKIHSSNIRTDYFPGF